MQMNKSTRLSHAAVLAILSLTAAQAGAAATNVTYKAEATLKETFDSNVYIQDNAPTAANVAAAQAAGLKPVEANKGSFVTSILPKIGLDYKPCSSFNLSLGYAPEIVFYHSTPSEDYVDPSRPVQFRWQIGRRHMGTAEHAPLTSTAARKGRPSPGRMTFPPSAAFRCVTGAAASFSATAFA